MNARYQAFLARHPYINGAIVAAESSALAFVINYFTSGTVISFTSAGLKSFAFSMAGAVAVGLRMWLKQSPIAQTTPPAA